uniref:Uncharacterized protein MANES_08G101200 n=1 Tax=Rhizophora mucronata TaxID=61149 RepID=A0A2P2L6B8_RHIMU
MQVSHSCYWLESTPLSRWRKCITICYLFSPSNAQVYDQIIFFYKTKQNKTYRRCLSAQEVYQVSKKDCRYNERKNASFQLPIAEAYL